MLLFAPAAICHRDRKQILIIVWTHRGGGDWQKKKKSLTTKWLSLAKLQNTVALCVRFPFPGMRLVLWLEVGLGRWMTSPVVLAFEFWHSGTLCFRLPPPERPFHLLSEAEDCAFSLPSPQRIPSFLFTPLKQLPAYEVEKMTLHLMMNGTWPPPPHLPGNLLLRGLPHFHKPGDLTHLFTSRRRTKVPQMKIKYLLINSTTNWTTVMITPPHPPRPVSSR